MQTQIPDKLLLRFLYSLCLPCQISRESIYYRAQKYFSSEIPIEQFDSVFDEYLKQMENKSGNKGYFKKFLKERQN